MTLGTVLEWLAFAASMTCVFCYGHSKRWGAVVGLVTAALFIAWGAVTLQHAAWLTNIVFLGLHGRNLARALAERTGHAHLR